MSIKFLRNAAILTLAASIWSPAVFSDGQSFTPWSDATPDLDTDNSVQGGCPHESRNGRTMYMATGRPGGHGMLDIWVAHRTNPQAPFGEAENLPEPINSEYADFCPTPLGGKLLMFVSTRPIEDVSCGSGDIYVSQNVPGKGWEDPVNLGCAEFGEGPNTSDGEFSPSLVETDEGVFLFYSTLDSGTNTSDIFMSQMNPDGSFNPGVPVDELNTEFDDRMPNISKDGLEIVFSSNRPRPGQDPEQELDQDVYSSTRESTDAPWSPPVNLGPGINEDGESETRASMSWDRKRLHFGRSGEIYVSHRSHSNGKDD